ncbi:MAG: 5-(carboxyamino)imidazole ribonucleotide mutase [Saccharofermentanales bacterium]
MKKVLVIMGSDSDFTVMQQTFKVLLQFGVGYHAEVCSAHRTPESAARIAQGAYDAGFGVVIAAAGLAAHLPGVIAAYTILPVIGVPIASGALNGIDALCSIVQMPTGIPVATVAIDGAANAAILAVQILACSDSSLADKLISYKSDLKNTVENRNQTIRTRMAEAGL